MKHTLIDFTYDAITHTYLVRLGTDMGEFTGSAQCKPEDYDVEASYFGYELAEVKANIKYCKAQYHHWDARARALTEFWLAMSTTRTYSEKDFWVKKMRQEVDDAFNKRTYWNDRYNDLKEAYHYRVVEADKLNKQRRAKHYD